MLLFSSLFLFFSLFFFCLSSLLSFHFSLLSFFFSDQIVVNVKVTLRIWDLFLYEGLKIVFQVGVFLVKNR